MKALIIENDWYLDDDLKLFLDNCSHLFPNGFTNLFNARQRDKVEVAKFISEHESIILESTFTHKDQIISLMSSFYDKKFGDKTYSFYIRYILSQLRDWTRPLVNGYLPDGHYAFYSTLAWPSREAHGVFISQLIAMITEERMLLYELRDEPAEEYPVAKRILYDVENQNFYFEGESPIRK